MHENQDCQAKKCQRSVPISKEDSEKIRAKCISKDFARKTLASVYLDVLEEITKRETELWEHVSSLLGTGSGVNSADAADSCGVYLKIDYETQEIIIESDSEEKIDAFFKKIGEAQDKEPGQ